MNEKEPQMSEKELKRKIIIWKRVTVVGIICLVSSLGTAIWAAFDEMGEYMLVISGPALFFSTVLLINAIFILKRSIKEKEKIVDKSEEDLQKWKSKRNLITCIIILVAGLACFIPSLYGFIEHFDGIGVFVYIPLLIISTPTVFLSSLMLILFNMKN